MLRVPCSDPGMVYQIVEQSMFTKGIDDYDMESGSQNAKRKECGQCDVSIFFLALGMLGEATSVSRLRTTFTVFR